MPIYHDSSTKTHERVIIDRLLNSSCTNSPYLKHNSIISSGTSMSLLCSNYSKIDSLIKYKLNNAIEITVEYDEIHYLAKTKTLPLYACGENREEAVKNLKYEIESLYEDLQSDDDFSPEWLKHKKYLNSIVTKKR
ncbi:MAG TPA: hypothetical protein PKW56_00145 [Clostridiales bacterium]|nr:hypothetical protein [Clostridiales bacterium]